jgi:hypothetical protein
VTRPEDLLTRLGDVAMRGGVHDSDEGTIREAMDELRKLREVENAARDADACLDQLGEVPDSVGTALKSALAALRDHDKLGKEG